MMILLKIMVLFKASFLILLYKVSEFDGLIRIKDGLWLTA